LKMTSKTGCLTSDSFHQAPITGEDCNILLVLTSLERNRSLTIGVVAD